MIGYNIDFLLGPGINIHRHPLNGRNFEYFSEDPYLAGIMTAAVCRGLSKTGGAAVIKHFTANNQELERRWVDSVASERAYREIYLRPYEIPVRQGVVRAIMTSYNRVNSVHAPLNYDLLTVILRGEWGFEGMVTTDWYTHAPQYTEIAAGNDVKMGCGDPAHTLKMMREGKLSREDVR